MGALGDQVQIKIPEKEPEAVGILHLLNGFGPLDPQSIRRRLIEPPGEQSARMDKLKTRESLSCFPRQHLDGQGTRHESSDDASSIGRV
jgi:hypothetical protein